MNALTYPPIRRETLGKALAVVVIVCVVLAALAVMFLLAPQEENPPEQMAVANFVEGEDHFETYFTLVDSEGNQVRADGNVTVVIYDDLATLYNDTFAVGKSDFHGYETLFGLELLACKWDIPFAEVSRSFGGGMSLDGVITFEHEGTEMSSGEQYVPLPDALKATLGETYSLTVNDHGRVGPGNVSYVDQVYVNVTMVNICPYQQDLWMTLWEVETSDGLFFSWGGSDPWPPDKLNSGAGFTWTVYFDVPVDKTPVKVIYYEDLEAALQ